MFEIDDYVPPPGNNKAGERSGSKYPFDRLEVGQSFHIPKTNAMPNPAHSLATTVSIAKRKYRTPIMENGKLVTKTVIVKKYAKDEYRRRIKGPDGNFILVDTVSVEEATFIQERDFSIQRVGGDDPRGPGARIWRTK